MKIIPSVCILDGHVVALYKGNYEQKATYSRTPIHMARIFENEGAECIQVVDENSRSGRGEIQTELLKHLLGTIKIPVQLEANFTTMEEIENAFNLGISRVILCPQAFGLFKQAVEKFGAEKIVVQIEAKDGQVIDGTPQENSCQDILDFAESLISIGIKTIIYKDIQSEGTMIHPNFDQIDRLITLYGKDFAIFASGGIGDLKHLALLKKIGTTGAVINKALFEGNFGLKQAIEVSV